MGRVTGEGRMAAGKEGSPSDCQPGERPRAGGKAAGELLLPAVVDGSDGGRLTHTLFNTLFEQEWVAMMNLSRTISH